MDDPGYNEYVRVKTGLENGTISDLEAAIYDVPTAKEWADTKAAMKAAVAKYKRPVGVSLETAASRKQTLFPQITFNTKG